MKSEFYYRFFQGYKSYRDGEDENELVLIKVKDQKTGKYTFQTKDGKAFFDQTHVDTIVGTARVEARKKAETEKSDLQKELEALRTQAEEKGQNVDALNAKIAELEEATMSVEEKATKRVKDMESQFLTEKQRLEAEVNKTMGMYREERIQTEIAGACAAHKAVSVETIAPLLRAQTELVPVHDVKKNVIGYQAVVHFRDKDETGAEVVRDLPVADAVKRMREMPERFGHLFVHEQEPGSGQRTLFGADATAVAKVADLVPGKTSQEDFNKAMDKLGL